MKGKLITAVLICFSSIRLLAQDIIVRDKYDSGFFPIVSVLHATSIYVDLKDHWLVHRSAQLLQQDIQMLTGFKPEIISSLPLSADNIIIIGSLDSSEIINRLSSEK